MHESFEKDRVASSRASLEGNVRVPQNPLGIAAHTAERCLLQSDIEQALTALLVPIPFDEHLYARVRKANAQHVHNSIGIPLSAEDIRFNLQAGNAETISLISASLGMSSFSPDDIMGTDEKGAWASRRLVDRIAEIVEALTPERVEHLRSLFSALTRLLDSDEVRDTLNRRRDMYQGWNEKPAEEAAAAKREADRLMDEVLQKALEAVYEEGKRGGSPSKEALAEGIMARIRQYAPALL